MEVSLLEENESTVLLSRCDPCRDGWLCSFAYCCSGCCVLVRTSSEFCSGLRGEESACMCKQKQLTWMRSETGMTLMNLPIKENMRSPKGWTSLQCVRNAEKEDKIMGESIHWLVDFIPICNTVNLSEADSNLSVLCYGAWAHAVFLRLEKYIFPLHME